jgi:flagellar biosynthesis protein FlhA
MPAWWISENQRSAAQLAGYMVVDPASVLITHLGEVLRRHAHELLSREDVKLLVDKVRATAPSLVDELIPSQLTLGTLHRVLCLLVEERVPISNLTRILEALSHFAGTVKDAVELAERIRPELGRDICDRFRDANNRLHGIVLEPRLHLELQRSLHQGHLVLEPNRLERLIGRLAEIWRRQVAQGQEVALLCDSSIRRALRQAPLSVASRPRRDQLRRSTGQYDALSGGHAPARRSPARKRQPGGAPGLRENDCASF